MTNRKNTKKALLSSVLALILCFTMLLGSTYAWFTDSASTAVNSIQSGTLDVDLVDVDGNSVVGQTLNFNYIDNEMWEPGASYELEDVYVVNNGNLALKYKIIITGVDGDAKLLEAIDWTCKVGGTTFDVKAGTQDHVLKANQTSSAIKIVGTMKTEAGNEYQGLTLDGIGITVLATQATVENDSYTNTYDANAEYEEIVPVANASELAEALIAGKGVQLTQNVTISDATVIKIPANSKITIDLNGKTLDASAQTSRPFEIADGTQLTINGEGANVKTGAYGLVNVPAEANVSVTLNGGNYTAETDNGAFIKVRKNAEAKITLNNVNYTDNSADGFLVNTYVDGTNAGAANITINGGNLKAAFGVQANNLVADGVTIDTAGFALQICEGTGKITNSTIKSGTLVGEDGAKAAGVAAGYAGVVHVENCTLECNIDFICYPGGDANDGEIYASNCIGADTYEYQEPATGKIVIDGQLK